ncbi:MAG: hypothetical protein WBC60_00040 [Cognaticolwellia sp.]|jgi:hypothetical protein
MVQYSKIEIQKVINELSNAVVSINKIGSYAEDLPKDEWKNAVIEYLVENSTLEKLSSCRYILSCGLESEDVTDLPKTFGKESPDWNYQEYVKRKGI